MAWLNLIWIVPVMVWFFIMVLIHVWKYGQYKKVRKINTQLYGDIASECILCPVCRGFVYVGVWDRHMNNGHYIAGYHIERIEQEFKKAAGNL